MKKTISVILILVLLFCSVYGFSFVKFRRSLVSLNSTIDSIGSFVSEKMSFLFSINHFVYIPGGSQDPDDDSNIVTDHYSCYLDYIRQAGFGSRIDNYLNNLPLSDIGVKSDLYSFKIKTDGVWYDALAIEFSYVEWGGTTFEYIFVSCAFTEFVGSSFTLKWYPFIGYVGAFNGEFATRDIEDLVSSEMLLSEIEHNCVLSN